MGDRFRVGHGVLQRDVAAPGLPDNRRLVQAKRSDHAGHVFDKRREVVTGVGLIAFAVATLVERDDLKIRGEEPGDEIPGLGRRGQTVQQNDWRPGFRPDANVELDVADSHARVLRSCYR